MRLESIELKNYRNYTSAHIEPCAEVSVFAGNNAQGKTNILEAVYLCCTGRSHRTQHDRELIKNGELSGSVKVDGLRRDGLHDVEIQLSCDGKRRIKVVGNTVSKSGELLGHITGVLFAPEDLRMVKDGPDVRRRFIDMELSQLRPAYYYALQRYNRALKQRNTYLKECSLNGKSADMLEVWDLQLAQSGAQIMKARADFVGRLSQTAQEIHAAVADGREKLEVGYSPNVISNGDTDEIESALSDALLASRAGDIRRCITQVGPHRDDISVKVDGLDARAYSSQGQVRTCALSLKLSEIDIMKTVTGEPPVLMLDDVMSELDPQRRRLLVSRLEGVQTLITCTDKDDLAGAEIGKLFHVKNAVITETEI